VAPHFQRLPSPVPTEAELQARARRLRLALEAAAPPALPVAGVGHSIGATLLLALAGAQVWTFARERLVVAAIGRLDRLALLAPATDFLRAPGALDAVRVPVLSWAGTRDAIVTPEQVRLIERGLAPRVFAQTRVVDGANHFSFMNVLPPRIGETLPERDAFLTELAREVGEFVTVAPDPIG
jgi:alpha-beta hydrolase superfamily lysophospholipase